ncbi:MAG: DUF4013 domain-containing protein [Methanoregula sp.]|nr:DUF4013 domain-containing protein [Methanoregula sp.]
MDIGKMIEESFEYAKGGLVGKWMKWILLLIATLLLTLPLLGYSLRILRGVTPSPEVDNWGTLFFDGIKYFIVGLIYAIPLIIIAFFTFTPAIKAAITGDTSHALAVIGTFFFGLIVFVIVAFIIGIFSTAGIIRLARTGSIGESFNFGAIIGTIGRIGWVDYIIALIIMGVLIGIIQFICMSIPYLGMFILFILIPFITLFQARYICILYDSAGTA